MECLMLLGIDALEKKKKSMKNENNSNKLEKMALWISWTNSIPTSIIFHIDEKKNGTR